MPDPVRLEIKAANGLWHLTRDDAKVAEFSHADRAVHEAVGIARELDAGGQPASVTLHAADGKVITVDVDPDITQEEERRGGDARV